MGDVSLIHVVVQFAAMGLYGFFTILQIFGMLAGAHNDPIMGWICLFKGSAAEILALNYWLTGARVAAVCFAVIGAMDLHSWWDDDDQKKRRKKLKKKLSRIVQSAGRLIVQPAGA